MELGQIHLRDPFVLADGDGYYLYGTGEHRLEGEVLHMTAYRSSDRLHWMAQPVRVCMHGIGATGDFWAPDVFCYCGRYYMFLTLCAKGRKRGTYVFMSDAPAGDYVPVSSAPVTPPEKQCLDATLYVEDGVPYLLYSWEWLEAGSGKIFLRRMKPDLSGCTGKAFELLDARESGVSECIEGMYGGARVSGYVTDSPVLYRHTEGEYLLLWSTFCKHGYCIALASCDNLCGRYRQEKLLFSEDGGHAMIYKTREGEQLISFHVPNKPPNERPVFYGIREREKSIVLYDTGS